MKTQTNQLRLVLFSICFDLHAHNLHGCKNEKNNEQYEEKVQNHMKT